MFNNNVPVGKPGTLLIGNNVTLFKSLCCLRFFGYKIISTTDKDEDFLFIGSREPCAVIAGPHLLIHCDRCVKANAEADRERDGRTSFKSRRDEG
jgi:hypothetical protein